jgi:hypothetical protein
MPLPFLSFFSFSFFLLLLVSCIPPSTASWLWRNQRKPDSSLDSHARARWHGSGLDLAAFGGDDEGLPRSSLMRQAQSMVGAGSLEASCWQQAYTKLRSSCHGILKDEEKKCRLAYEFTDCFLRMTGWPPPPKCSEKTLVKYCTQKVDAHTHEIYRAFFVEAGAMCHHLQLLQSFTLLKVRFDLILSHE